MALFDKLVSGTVGLGKGLFSAGTAFARATPSGFMMAGGALAGSALAAASGDNYSSTDLARNIIGGAVAGGAVGLGARALFSRTAARGASRFMGISQARAAASGTRMAAWGRSPLGGLLGTGARGTRGALGAGAGLLGFAARHPGVVIGGAIVAGGAMAMSTNFTTEQDTSDRFTTVDKDVQRMDTGMTGRQFANSASGLCFGLHSRRHR